MAVTGDRSLNDFDRALAPEGMVACAAVAAHLQSKHVRLDHAILSPAKRTAETANLVLSALEQHCTLQWADKLYLGSPGDVLHAVHAAPPDASNLLLVAHNPGIQQFAAALAGHGHAPARESLELSYPTASLAELTFDGSWAGLAFGQATLVSFFVPGTPTARA